MPDRTRPPKIHEISLPTIPHTEEVSLDNGVIATVLNQGAQPVLLLELIFPIGRFNEPVPGIAYYTAKMLAEGTTSRNSEQIASAFDFYGSHLEINATLDFIHIKLYALNQFFPELVRLLAEILMESTFPEKEFHTLQQIRIQQIRQQFAKNNAYASIKFRERLFGPTHPYGLIIDEKLAEAVTLDQVWAFKQHLLAKPFMFLSGMVTSREIGLLNTSFGKMTFSELLPDVEADSSPEESETVSREGSTQASIRIGHTTLTRSSPDIHLLRITNELFGGFFGSRLMKNIREEKGLTYGIHSSISHLQQASYWSVSTEVLHDKLDLAINEIAAELNRLQDTPPTPEEFGTVINYMKGKYLNSFDSPFHSLNMLKNLKLAGIPTSYLDEFIRTLNEAAPEDISRVARQHLTVEDALTITVI